MTIHPVEERTRMCAPVLRLRRKIRRASGLMQFLELPHDVLFNVLHWCTVEDILTIERTCKSIAYAISQTRSIWLSALFNTPSEKSPHITPHQPVSSLGIAELRRLAVRGIRRWKNWNSKTGLTLLRTGVLATNDYSWSIYMAKFLPCGCHLLVQRLSSMECWDLRSKEIVWRLLDKPNCHMPFFGLHLDEPNLVTIARTGFGTDKLIFQVVQLDLTTMTSVRSSSRVMPYRPVGFRPSVCGDVALVPLCDLSQQSALRAWVMNWRTGDCMFLDIQKVSTPLRRRLRRLDFRHEQALRGSLKVCGIGLAGRNIVYISESGYELNVIPVDALAGSWSKDEDHTKWTCHSLTSVPTVSIPLPSMHGKNHTQGHGYGQVQIQCIRTLVNLTVHTSTWTHTNHTAISLLIKEEKINSNEAPTAMLYQCSLYQPEESNTPIELTLSSYRPVQPKWPDTALSINGPGPPPHQSTQGAVLITVHGTNVLMEHSLRKHDPTKPVTVIHLATDIDPFADVLLFQDKEIGILSLDVDGTASGAKGTMNANLVRGGIMNGVGAH